MFIMRAINVELKLTMLIDRAIRGYIIFCSFILPKLCKNLPIPLINSIYLIVITKAYKDV